MIDYPKRGEIYWVRLDPTVGSEIQKIRPALVISNNLGNEVTKRVIVAPIISSVENIYPFQVGIELDNKPRKILLDQIRTVDKLRLGKNLGSINRRTLKQVEKAIKISLSLS